MDENITLDILENDLINDIFGGEESKVTTELQPGEIYPSLVARKTGLSVSCVCRRLQRLEAQGVLESHWAYDPKSKRNVMAYRKVTTTQKEPLP